MFSTITNLMFKRAASEHFVLPPLPKPEWEVSPVTCLTKPGSFSTIDTWQLCFGRTILLGSVVFIGGIITWELISWYVNESQNIEVFMKYSRNDNLLLKDNWLRGDVCCWENLPLEMWGEIGKRMVSRLDIVCFRSVCKKWRSSLPSPTSRFPLLLPPPPTCDPEFRNMPYAISEVTIYRTILGTAMMQVDESGMFNLLHNLSLVGDKADFDQASLMELPCLLRTCMSVLDDKDDELYWSTISFSSICFFAKVYYPCMALDSHKIRHERQCSEFPKKLVLISSSNENPNYARMSDLTVVAHLGGEGRLALLRLGGPPENWVWDTGFCSQVFVNIANYEGKLCTLDSSGKVFLMDYNSLQLTQVCAPLSVPFELEGKSLFEAFGDLYLVDFHVTTSYGFEAYKLSWTLQKWLKLEGMAEPDFKYVAPFLL